MNGSLFERAALGVAIIRGGSPRVAEAGPHGRSLSRIDGAVQTLDDLTAREYVESDPLLDHLSVRQREAAKRSSTSPYVFRASVVSSSQTALIRLKDSSGRM